jgi:hypothetical protein
MNQQGINTSTTQIYENYLRPLTKQGVINSTPSIINAKENLYYPVNQENDDGSHQHPLHYLYCGLSSYRSKPFDERSVLEESFRTLLGRRSNGGGVNKYKIIDIDGKEISLFELLDKYFFSENHHTSCSVIETKYYNNVIEECPIDDGQTKGVVIENIENLDEANELSQLETIKKSYECYYCDKFVPTDNRDDYEKHVVLSHERKLAYPSKADLERNNLKPQGKGWEI